MTSDNHKYKKYLVNNPETRWARINEIKADAMYVDLEAESYPVAGLPLLANAKEAYVDGKDTHTLIFGATGSKKTRLFCLPMLNMFAKAGESFVVTDPKGELYAKTANFVKKQGYDTVVLNFRDIGAGDSWNPFALPFELYHSKEFGDKDKGVAMLGDLISVLNAKQEKTTVDNFWPTMTRSYLMACALMLLEYGNKDVANLTSLAACCRKENAILLDEISRNMDPESIAGMNFMNVFSAASKTKQSILAVAYSVLGEFNSQKSLSNMLAHNSIDIRTIGRKKTAVYLIIPDEKTTLHFLASTFIKQAYEVLVGEAQKEINGRLPIRVNFVLDEFCNMPKIPDMPAMISAARSRNIRYFLVAQSAHQLRGKYGEDAETIKGNCDNWIFLTSKELSLLNEISDLCGSVIDSNGKARKLISTSELQRLNKETGEALVMHARLYPYITNFPDIDDYECFRCELAQKPERIEFEEAESISIRNMYLMLRNGEIDMLFPSPDFKEFVVKDMSRAWM